MEIHGYIASGFEKVADAFRDNFVLHNDVGASCCIYRDGQPVVDIWGGLANPAEQQPWAENTIQLCFSATKGVTTLCVLQLVESGQLDLNEPIATYWPEFRCAGKEKITTAMVLSHRAGLAAIDGDLTLEEVLAGQPVIDAIARQTPNWEPDSDHGYHTRSFGWILGEVVRRITGYSLGQYLQKYVAQPLDTDFWVGIPENEFQRCAKLIPDSAPLAFDITPSPLTIHSLTGPSNLFSYSEMWNEKALLMAEIPSSNGVGNGRSLAKIYASTLGEVNGVRLLKESTVASACKVRSHGIDKIITLETCFGLGFMLPPWLIQNHCGPKSYGHFGAGGSFAMADPEANVSIGYVMNKMSMSPDDVRSLNLVKAMYASL